jgi:hypothetical protein
MPRETQTPAPPPPADYRVDAETRGRLAFEQATADPKPTPEPLSWLWKSLPKKGKESR